MLPIDRAHRADAEIDRRKPRLDCAADGGCYTADLAQESTSAIDGALSQSELRIHDCQFPFAQLRVRIAAPLPDIAHCVVQPEGIGFVTSYL